MANTREEIKRIHTNRLATPNSKYYGDDGRIYVGTPDKRLRVLEPASLTTLQPSETLTENNVQSAVDDINSRIRKQYQVEVDFGLDPYKSYKTFTIFNSDIKQGDYIIANIAYEAPLGKALDEIEMDPIICTAGTAIDGSFKLLVKGLEGSLRERFKINYIISWQ